MVGQLPLEQHIGVRIPEGQPLIQLQPRCFSTSFDVSLLSSTLLQQVAAVYDHAKYIDDRIVMMQLWADALDELREGKTGPYFVVVLA